MELLRRLLPPPSRERFAARVVAALSTVAGGEAVRYEPDGFRVVVGVDESSRVVNLGNFYTRYRSSWPWHRPERARKTTPRPTRSHTGRPTRWMWMMISPFSTF